MKIVYLRDFSTPNKTPIGCIAFESDASKRQIRYAFSVCSPRDRFDKQKARAIAEVRLKENPERKGKKRRFPITLECEVPETYSDLLSIIMKDIVQKNTEQPDRSFLAFQAATCWLEPRDTLEKSNV